MLVPFSTGSCRDARYSRSVVPTASSRRVLVETRFVAPAGSALVDPSRRVRCRDSPSSQLTVSEGYLVENRSISADPCRDMLACAVLADPISAGSGRDSWSAYFPSCRAGSLASCKPISAGSGRDKTELLDRNGRPDVCRPISAGAGRDSAARLYRRSEPTVDKPISAGAGRDRRAILSATGIAPKRAQAHLDGCSVETHGIPGRWNCRPRPISTGPCRD